LFRSIAGTIECVVQNTEGCALDEQESLNRTLQYTLDLIGDQCKDNVKVHTILIALLFQY